jgi:hypothetical protein
MTRSLVIDPATGERARRRYRRIEGDPVGVATEAVRRAKLRLGEAQGEVQAVRRERDECEAARGEIARRWAEEDPGAGRLEEENNHRWSATFGGEASAEDKVRAAEELLRQRQAELGETQAAYLPDLAREMEANEIATFLEVQARAVAVLEELVAARSALGERHRPLKRALIEWSHNEGMARGRDFPDDVLTSRATLPDLPVDVHSLRSFDPRSATLCRLLAALDREDAERARRKTEKKPATARS